jgi:hypothetical protein
VPPILARLRISKANTSNRHTSCAFVCEGQACIPVASSEKSSLLKPCVYLKQHHHLGRRAEQISSIGIYIGSIGDSDGFGLGH